MLNLLKSGTPEICNIKMLKSVTSDNYDYGIVMFLNFEYPEPRTSKIILFKNKMEIYISPELHLKYVKS